MDVEAANNNRNAARQVQETAAVKCQTTVRAVEVKKSESGSAKFFVLNKHDAAKDVMPCNERREGIDSSE